MAVLDMDDPVSRVRLNVGDYQDVQLLPDSVIEYALTKNASNETAATKDCAYWILSQLSYGSRKRLDRIELYGSEPFQNYLKFIQEVIKNPNSAMNLAGMYVGGVFKQDVIDIATDSTIAHKYIPEYSTQDAESRLNEMGLISYDTI